MRFSIFALLISIQITCILAAISDLHFDKCKLEDSICMTKAFQKALPIFAAGIPDIGIEVLDAMTFDKEINFSLAGLTFSLSDGQLQGFKDIVINNVRWETEKKIITVKYQAQSFSLSGNYSADGKILLLPITGVGRLEAVLRNLNMNVRAFCEERKKGGKTYAFVKNFDYDYDVNGNAHYNLTNLFNGNKKLSDAILTLINDNGKEIINEFAKPVMDAVGRQVFKNVNRFLGQAPLEDISYSYK